MTIKGDPVVKTTAYAIATFKDGRRIAIKIRSLISLNGNLSRLKSVLCSIIEQHAGLKPDESLKLADTVEFVDETVYKEAIKSGAIELSPTQNLKDVLLRP